VTKKDMAKAIAGETGLAQTQAQQVIQRVFAGITEALLTEGRIELRDFGVVEIRRRKPRKARNPRTGDRVNVPAKVVVTFKPGKEMEQRVSRLKAVPGRDAGAVGNHPA
jgi:nucleoid DNA-binding protein